eukprot:TRINITY_DN13986_c0_g1_i1.p2 TRINITY_DN13986_c0_g1~~TRINITY_DN13986_c0_g1_i1.p2  ORF type:complete len:148 (-),score=40.99 TRINITY_DN13986_c0_g1_i1:2-445(-)
MSKVGKVFSSERTQRLVVALAELLPVQINVERELRLCAMETIAQLSKHDPTMVGAYLAKTKGVGAIVQGVSDDNKEVRAIALDTLYVLATNEACQPLIRREAGLSVLVDIVQQQCQVYDSDMDEMELDSRGWSHELQGQACYVISVL